MMGVNWLIIIISGGLLVGLVVFLVIRNLKDEREFEHQLNEEFDTTETHKEDNDPDNVRET